MSSLIKLRVPICINAPIKLGVVNHTQLSNFKLMSQVDGETLHHIINVTKFLPYIQAYYECYIGYFFDFGWISKHITSLIKLRVIMCISAPIQLGVVFHTYVKMKVKWLVLYPK